LGGNVVIRNILKHCEDDSSGKESDEVFADFGSKYYQLFPLRRFTKTTA
jgi:hypothetical protein